MKNIKYKIAVMSNKGGVGKSTIAFNIAVALAEAGSKVGILDADLHGPNMAKMVGVEGKKLGAKENKILPLEVSSNLKLLSLALVLDSPDEPVIWRGPLKMKAIKQFVEDTDWGELDCLVIDLPPGTGDEPLSVMQLISDLDGVIIITTPQDVALLDSKKALNFVRELKMPVLGIIENMSVLTCPFCGKEIELFKKGGGEAAAKDFGVPFLGRIPIEPAIVELSDKGKAFVSEKKESAATKSIEEIARKLSDKFRRS